MKRKMHILGSGNAAKRHREAIERFPEVYTITGFEEADIVDCCGIPAKNYEQAHGALYNGKDVILEKPFAEDTYFLESLILTEENCVGRVYPVLNYRHLNYLEGSDLVWKRDPSYYAGWRGKKEKAFGGVIMSHGIHVIDHAICRNGNVGALYCSTQSDPAYECEVETSASIILGFASGYAIEINLMIDHKYETKGPPNPGWDHFFKDLDSAPRLEELYHLQAVIDACYQSASEERWVTVS